MKCSKRRAPQSPHPHPVAPLQRRPTSVCIYVFPIHILTCLLGVLAFQYLVCECLKHKYETHPSFIYARTNRKQALRNWEIWIQLSLGLTHTHSHTHTQTHAYTQHKHTHTRRGNGEKHTITNSALNPDNRLLEGGCEEAIRLVRPIYYHSSLSFSDINIKSSCLNCPIKIIASINIMALERYFMDFCCLFALWVMTWRMYLKKNNLDGLRHTIIQPK